MIEIGLSGRFIWSSSWWWPINLWKIWRSNWRKYAKLYSNQFWWQLENILGKLNLTIWQPYKAYIWPYGRLEYRPRSYWPLNPRPRSLRESGQLLCTTTGGKRKLKEDSNRFLFFLGQFLKEHLDSTPRWKLLTITWVIALVKTFFCLWRYDFPFDFESIIFSCVKFFSIFEKCLIVTNTRIHPIYNESTLFTKNQPSESLLGWRFLIIGGLYW